MHWLGPVSVQCIHVDAPANGSQMAGRQMVVPRSPPAPLISGRPVGRTHPSRSHHHPIRAAKEQSAGRPGRWLVSAGWLVVRYLPGSKLHAACSQPVSEPASQWSDTSINQTAFLVVTCDNMLFCSQMGSGNLRQGPKTRFIS